MEGCEKQDNLIRTGIYGGNFNPIHNGHLRLALEAMEQFALEEVWFLPAAVQPFKQNLPVPDVRHRAAMIELAIRDIPHFSLCDYEMNKPGISYTFETMQYLKEACPERKFFFLMGEDSARSFLRWKHPEIICSCASLIIAPRGKKSGLAKEAAEIAAFPGAEVFLLDAPVYNISSTEIRQRWEEENFCSRHLNPDVREYISAHHLYDGKEEGT